MRFVWPLLSFVVGYVLGWYLFGAPAGQVLMVSLLTALLLASPGSTSTKSALPKSGWAGQFDFLRTLLMLTLIGVMLGLVLMPILYLPMLLLPDNPLPFGPSALLLPALLGLAVLLGCGWLFRTLLRHRARQDAVSPGGRSFSSASSLLLLAGVLTFSFFPAVRVDCRGLKQDAFMRYGTGFSGVSADQVYWARNPHLIPDRTQLPANFEVMALKASVTRCFQNKAGNRRPFTFGKSAPVIVLHLMEKTGGRIFAAAFEVGTHRKLTPWVQANSPFDSATQHPYWLSVWDVYPELRDIPIELQPWLRPQPVVTGK